jgi:hypothetical protein
LLTAGGGAGRLAGAGSDATLVPGVDFAARAGAGRAASFVSGAAFAIPTGGAGGSGTWLLTCAGESESDGKRDGNNGRGSGKGAGVAGASAAERMARSADRIAGRSSAGGKTTITAALVSSAELGSGKRGTRAIERGIKCARGKGPAVVEAIVETSQPAVSRTPAAARPTDVTATMAKTLWVAMSTQRRPREKATRPPDLKPSYAATASVITYATFTNSIELQGREDAVCKVKPL